MSDLIRRDEALKAIVDERTHTILQAWINVKNTVPSVDAVEVVRCKECKWDKAQMIPKKVKCIYQHNADDFCSYGERREP